MLWNPGFFVHLDPDYKNPDPDPSLIALTSFFKECNDVEMMFFGYILEEPDRKRTALRELYLHLQFEGFFLELDSGK